MTALEVIGWYVLGAGFVSVLVLTVAIHFYGKVPPLLDGTPLQSVLDDRDRRRRIDEADARLALLVELEQMWNLEPREPHA